MAKCKDKENLKGRKEEIASNIQGSSNKLSADFSIKTQWGERKKIGTTIIE